MSSAAKKQAHLGDRPSSSRPNQVVDYAEHLRLMQTEGTSEAAYRSAADYYERELLPILPAALDARTVDIGSGYGHLVRFLLENGRTQVGAVDLSEQLLEALTEYVGDRLEFTLHEDGVNFLIRHPNAFDCITMFDVLEHLEPARHQETVSAIYGALRPGGRIIIRVPNMANLLGAYSRYLDYTHQFGFTEFSLYQLLQMGEFREPHLFMPLPHRQLKKRLRQKMSRWVHRRLLKWDLRNEPQCLDKNVIVWAEKPLGMTVTG